ncbi:MAG: hypothetical protein ACREPX_02610 [Rhodanobacteraceae bacterium]
MKRLTCLGTACLFALCRTAFAADGDPDLTFSTDGEALVSWPYSIFGVVVAIAADGSIFHAATEAREGDVEVNLDFAVSKFRPNGTLDTSFGFLGQRSVGFDVIEEGDDSLLGAFALPNGGVLLAGTVDLDPVNFTYGAPGLIRLTADGDADPSFGDNGRRYIPQTPLIDADDLDLNAVAMQPDGKLVFAGDCFSCEGGHLVVALRVTANGTVDSTFGDDGWSIFVTEEHVEISSLAIDPWGRAVLGGSAETDEEPDDRPWLMRLTPSGHPDPAFGNGSGFSFLAGVPSAGGDWRTPAIAIDADGSIVLALDNAGAGVARARADGSLDTTFANGGFRDMVREDGAEMRAVAIRGDHRIVVAGGINHTGGDYDTYVGRLLADGTLDSDFDSNGVIRINMIAGADESANAIAFSAGRPVIVGGGGADRDTGTVLRLQSDLIFADGCGN